MNVVVPGHYGSLWLSSVERADVQPHALSHTRTLHDPLATVVVPFKHWQSKLFGWCFKGYLCLQEQECTGA